MDFDEHIDRNQYPTLKWSRAFLSEHFGKNIGAASSFLTLCEK